MHHRYFSTPSRSKAQRLQDRASKDILREESTDFHLPDGWWQRLVDAAHAADRREPVAVEYGATPAARLKAEQVQPMQYFRK